MSESFSSILVKYRHEKGLTQAEMAVKLGISERMYWYYEKGEYDGSPKRIQKYLQKLSSNATIETNETNNKIEPPPEIERYKNKIASLEREIELLKELVEVYKANTKKLDSVDELKPQRKSSSKT